MKLKATEDGILIPKTLLEGIQEVEIHKDDHGFVFTPVNTPDPIWGLGADPIHLGITDAATQHDAYLCSIQE